jgi:hypothetical protein
LANLSYRQTTLERLIRNDEATRFWTRGLLEGFQHNDLTIFPNEEVLPQRGWRYSFGGRGKRNPQRGNLIQNHAQERNPIQEPSQRWFDGDYEIMSKFIAFGSPVASSYTQSNNITSKQQNLIMMSIRPWLQATISKFTFGIVLSEIWRRVKYQKVRGLHHLSNRYLSAFIRSTVQVLWLLHDDGLAENCNSGQIAVMRKK